ncbi:MAG: hypothetical protein JO265_07145 [Acidimicrobiia bacterium]|nr:hypothetical protein [Acidimicrobiia bacterium]
MALKEPAVGLQFTLGSGVTNNLQFLPFDNSLFRSNVTISGNQAGIDFGIPCTATTRAKAEPCPADPTVGLTTASTGYHPSPPPTARLPTRPRASRSASPAGTRPSATVRDQQVCA